MCDLPWALHRLLRRLSHSKTLLSIALPFENSSLIALTLYSSLSSVVHAFIDASIDYHSIAKGDSAPETIELPGNHREVHASRPKVGLTPGHEALKARAVVGELAETVQDQIHDLLSNSVVTC